MFRRVTKYSFILWALLLTTLVTTTGRVAAQSTPPVVEAVLEPDSVAIGDQFTLKVTVIRDLVQMIDFPTFQEKKIGDKIEIINEGPIDTVARDGRAITLSKKYLLTTFDEGNYSLGKFPMLYMDKNIVDTLWSRDSIFLKVGTFEIDTTTQTIYDIQQPMSTPLKLGELSGYLFWGLLIGAVIALVVVYILRRRKNRPLFGKPAPIDPPHVAAIKALEALHNQKIWQNNKHKLYYTRLTDIIREYLEGRYAIHAPEMTSDEIMEAVSRCNIAEQSSEQLRKLLKSADMVKFAKYIPEWEENEASYTCAYYFVEQTKPSEIEVPIESEPQK